MKNETLQAWLTLAANIGVLIGIILLVFELGQNDKTMRAQTRNELSNGSVELFSLIGSNEQLASLRRRADEGEELTADEHYQYGMITRSFFRYWENVYYQYQQGTYDEAEYARQRSAWAGYAARSAALGKWWCTHRLDFSEEFMAEFDSVLASGTCG